MQSLKKRLPASDAILPVFAVISFLVYGWTIVVFFWKLPSWLMFLTVSELLGVFAYSMAACLVESLVILGILLLFCLILPASMMKDVFVTRGSIAALVGLASIMLYMIRFSEIGYSFLDSLIRWSTWGLVATVLLTFIAARFKLIVRLAAWTSDRLLVFLYLFVPISLISVLVVVYRNIF